MNTPMNILFVPPEERTVSAREFLQQQFPDLPAGHLAQLLKRGKFRGESGPLSEQSELHGGAPVALPGSASFRQRVAAGSPAILFENDTALVVNKPALLAVHRGLGHEQDNLLQRLDATLRRRRQPYRLHAVHRLDRETSGALLLAKGKRAAGEYGRRLMAGEVAKQYLALVRGELDDSGLLQAPLAQRGKLRAAATAYRTLARNDGFSLLELELHSGRTHQIRRHLAAAGAPLHGDRRYGGANSGEEQFFLHCRRLGFPLADGAAHVSVCAPPPEALLARLLRLGLRCDAALPELESYARNLDAGLCISARAE